LSPVSAPIEYEINIAIAMLMLQQNQPLVLTNRHTSPARLEWSYKAKEFCNCVGLFPTGLRLFASSLQLLQISVIESGKIEWQVVPEDLQAI
jgi:hypothetical protein